MEYYLSSGKNNDGKNEKPPITSEQLISVLEDLAIYPVSGMEDGPANQFVLTILQKTKQLLGADPALVEDGVIHAIGELVREGKTPEIRKAAIDNLEDCRISICRLHGLSKREPSLVPAATTALNNILNELQLSLIRIDNANDTEVGQCVLMIFDRVIKTIRSSGWDGNNKPIPEACKILVKALDFLKESMTSHPDATLRKEEVTLYTDIANSSLLQDSFSLKAIQDALLLSAVGDPCPKVRYRAFSSTESLYTHHDPYHDVWTQQLAKDRHTVSAEALDIALSSMANDTDSTVRRAAVNLVHATLPYVEKSSIHRIYESMADLAEKENDWDVLENAAATVHKLERSSSWADIRQHANRLYKAFNRASEQGKTESARFSCISAALVETLRVRQKIEIERALNFSLPPRPLPR